MTFGGGLRTARESRGWTRFYLTLVIKERFKADGFTITEGAIKGLENGIAQKPRGTTRMVLIAIFPELSQTVP
jgi:hypothetical protein